MKSFDTRNPMAGLVRCKGVVVSDGPNSIMKEKTHLKANRPRMPALVKREMKNEDDEGEDTTRLNFKGFDKAKLQSSRKAARKEKRMAKKQHKQLHQQAHATEIQKLRKLKEENERLRKQLL
eukprot:750875-Hanusia_phi.AAC.1